MKLIDAIYNVERPENAYRWAYEAPIDTITESLGIAGMWDFPEELDGRILAYPIFNWLCTDTHVGIDALYLDDRPMGYTTQTARKNGIVVKWLSKECAEKMRAVIMSFMETPAYDLIDPEEEIGEFQGVGYVGQSLTDDGYYEGRPVKALIWYDGLSGRTTDPQYRREGKAYTVSVPYKDPKSNCVLVRDGDEERLISIEDFKIRINVVPDCEHPDKPAGV